MMRMRMTLKMMTKTRMMTTMRMAMGTEKCIMVALSVNFSLVTSM